MPRKSCSPRRRYRQGRARSQSPQLYCSTYPSEKDIRLYFFEYMAHFLNRNGNTTDPLLLSDSMTWQTEQDPVALACLITRDRSSDLLLH